MDVATPTQEEVVACLTSNMARLGADGQAKIVAELGEHFGTYKVPEINPSLWPKVMAMADNLL